MHIQMQMHIVLAHAPCQWACQFPHIPSIPIPVPNFPQVIRIKIKTTSFPSSGAIATNPNHPPRFGLIILMRSHQNISNRIRRKRKRKRARRMNELCWMLLWCVDRESVSFFFIIYLRKSDACNGLLCCCFCAVLCWLGLCCTFARLPLCFCFCFFLFFFVLFVWERVFKKRKKKKKNRWWLLFSLCVFVYPYPYPYPTPYSFLFVCLACFYYCYLPLFLSLSTAHFLYRQFVENYPLNCHI